MSVVVLPLTTKYLAHGVKELVEVAQNAAAGDLSDVVHTLAGIVSHTRVLVAKAH